MRGLKGRALVAAAVAAALAPAGQARAQAPAVQAPCQQAGLKGASCATVSVPLDYGAPGGARISLRVAAFPATGRRKGTIFFLPGGPGQAAIPSAARFLESQRALRVGYDVVFADPRGTGASSPLRCAAFPDGDIPSSLTSPEDAAAAAAACGNELGGARRFFTTYETVLDVESIRQALAVDKIIPLGVSYGGQVAGEYARRHPAHVQALVLDSSSPVEGADALAKLPTLAIPRVLRETCFPPGCRAIFGDPEARLQQLAGRLRDRELRGRVVLPTGKRRAGTVDAGDVYSLLRASDTDPALRTALPAAIAAGADGDAAPLLRLLLGASEGGGAATDVNDVRFLATECVEGRLPWASTSDPATRPALLAQALAASPGSWSPFPPDVVVATSSAPLCAGWPATERPPYVPSPQRGPDVPVLVLAGRDDLRTPLEDQRRTAAQYPQARVLAVPNTGHSVLGSDLSGCASEGLAAFLAGTPLPKCPAEQLLPLAPPAPASLGDLPTLRAASLPGKVERTAIAVDLTMRDISRQLASLVAGTTTNATVSKRRLRLGGLRGGRLLATGKSVRLLSYEVVPGVRLTGTMEDEADRATLQVSGSGATGTVRSTGSGRREVWEFVLDGERFRYRPQPLLG